MDVEFHGYAAMARVQFDSEMVEPEDGEGFSPRARRPERDAHVFEWCDSYRTRRSHKACHGWYIASVTSANHQRGDLVMCECPRCDHQPPDPIPTRFVHGGPRGEGREHV
jgi:hypothetical protein